MPEPPITVEEPVRPAVDPEPSEPGVPLSEPAPEPPVSWPIRFARSAAAPYAAAVSITALLLTLMMQLWRASWEVPFAYTSDAVSSAATFKTTIETGWYENQPALGAPYGQHYRDFPFTDDLNPAMAKLIGLFTGQVGVVVNVYYVLGFLLCAAAAVYFFRVLGLNRPLTVVLAVLFALAPYHFVRGEVHLYLASYFCVPLAMVVVLRAIRGEQLWSRRPGVHPVLGVLTGRGAGTAAALALVTWSAAYYGLFTVILLVAAAILGFVRHRNRRRLWGALAGAGVVLAAFAVALAPDIGYAVLNGSNTGAVARTPPDAERYGIKPIALLLPAPGHPLFGWFRTWYDQTYPFPAEDPALGLVAAIGFVVAMAMPLIGISSRAQLRPDTPAVVRFRGRSVRDLAALIWVALLMSMFGGFGMLLSYFVTTNIRGWNRMSIYIALLALGVVGFGVQALGERIRRRSAGTARWQPAVLAGLLLIVGCADQWLTIAVPQYEANRQTWDSDDEFVQSVQATLPAGAMLFQLPYQAFPESNPRNGLSANIQLRMFLHSDTLRWSGGGITGRPQSDWPEIVDTEPARQMITDLVALGFDGIVLNRAAYYDQGATQAAGLLAVLGPPARTSRDGTYWYYSLAPARMRAELISTPAQRQARAAALLGGTAGS